MKILETKNGTAFVQYRHKQLNKLDVPLYATIDWLELAKQKLRLLEIIEGERGSMSVHPLEGLIALIDNIQDDAEAAGYPVVWFFAEDDLRNGEIEEDDE
jgi:hypothetical protein